MNAPGAWRCLTGVRLPWVKDSTRDRISCLPDDVLHHILSFTTARQAVQTCALSTRWRHIWQSLRCVNVEVGEFTSKEGFMKLMDNLLLCRDGISLDSFRLRNTKGSVFVNHPTAGTWVCHVLNCNVRVLGINQDHHLFNLDDELYFTWSDRTVLRELFNLDHSSFTSAHLKILNLYCVYGSADFIEKLFSGCPALEDLAIIKCHVMAFKFFSRTLKNLIIESLSPAYGYNIEDYEFEELVIDIPSLVSLYLKDIPYFAPHLVNVSSVVKASICLHNSDIEHCNILNALSNVTDLTLESPPCQMAMDALQRDMWKCHAFNKLKVLSVDERCISLLSTRDGTEFGLIQLLRCSPNIEKLNVHLTSLANFSLDEEMVDPEAYKADKLFNCKHLKEVKITCWEHDGSVDCVVRVILANAITIPKIVIEPDTFHCKLFDLQNLVRS